MLPADYITMNLLTVKNIDLRRKVKYKPRKRQRNEPNKPKHREGRSFEDYFAYISENPNLEIIQMDTVIG